MNVSVIGNGGIGSFFAQHIDKLIDLKQLDKSMKFTFYDDDKVEMKNLLYQNFESIDIDSYKTDALARRYFNIKFVTKRINNINCDLVILCVDNNKIRREIWNSTIPFIDARANGRAIGIFSSETDNYLGTLGDDDRSSSCQNPFQIAREEIEYGNVVVAAILAQVVLNYSRTKKLPANFMVNI